MTCLAHKFLQLGVRTYGGAFKGGKIIVKFILTYEKQIQCDFFSLFKDITHPCHYRLINKRKTRMCKINTPSPRML